MNTLILIILICWFILKICIIEEPKKKIKKKPNNQIPKLKSKKSSKISKEDKRNCIDIDG